MNEVMMAHYMEVQRDLLAAAMKARAPQMLKFVILFDDGFLGFSKDVIAVDRTEAIAKVQAERPNATIKSVCFIGVVNA